MALQVGWSLGNHQNKFYIKNNSRNFPKKTLISFKTFLSDEDTSGKYDIEKCFYYEMLEGCEQQESKDSYKLFSLLMCARDERKVDADINVYFFMKIREKRS